MKLRNGEYYIQEVARSLKRNNWMSFASIGTVAVSLFVLGVFLTLVLNMNRLAATLESEVQISVYLEDKVMPTQREEIKQDIEKILYSYPDSLSVGECQRIAFAQVLIKEPRIIILDEPTGTMDPITKTIVAKSVVKARETLGETFVVVSHDMDFVMNCCDRAAFMKGGKVVSIGSPEDVLEEFGMEPVPEGEEN